MLGSIVCTFLKKNIYRQQQCINRRMMLLFQRCCLVCLLLLMGSWHHEGHTPQWVEIVSKTVLFYSFMQLHFKDFKETFFLIFRLTCIPRTNFHCKNAGGKKIMSAPSKIT